jgi:hypothetical protein
VTLAGGSEPGRVVEGPPGHAFIALRRGGAVVDLDVAAGTVGSPHSVCSAPRGLAWNGTSLYVACAGGELVTLDNTLSNASSQFVIEDLRDVVVSADGLLLSTFRSAHLYLLDNAGNLIQRTGTGVFGVDDQEDYDSTTTATQTFSRSVAWRMVPAPGGALIVHQHSQASEIEAGQTSCSGTYGVPFAGLPRVHAWAEVLTGSKYSAIAGVAQITDHTLPVDIARSPAGRIAVVGAGARVVSVFESQSVPVTTLRQNLISQPTAVAFRGEDAVVFSREPATIDIFPADGSAQHISLPAGSAESTGHRVFHEATNTQLACASCHPEGGDDGHVWELPEGTRRTPSLRGRLRGTEPFHWSGDEADMNALLDDVLVTRMSGPHETPERQQAVLDWLDTQDVLPAPPGDAAQIARGEATFNTRCTSCHAGAQGTNNTTVDVGTGGTFQVPRLHELWYRAPFMHDGRAATLADRFGAAGGTSHGDTASLSASDLDDLIAYLRAR